MTIAIADVEILEVLLVSPVAKVIAGEVKGGVRMIVVLSLFAIGSNDRSRANEDSKVGIAFENCTVRRCKTDSEP